MKGSQRASRRNHLRSPFLMGSRLRVMASVGSMTSVAMARRMAMRMVTVICSSVRKSSLVRIKLMPQKTTERLMRI